MPFSRLPWILAGLSGRINLNCLNDTFISQLIGSFVYLKAFVCRNPSEKLTRFFPARVSRACTPLGGVVIFQCKKSFLNVILNDNGLSIYSGLKPTFLRQKSSLQSNMDPDSSVVVMVLLLFTMLAPVLLPLLSLHPSVKQVTASCAVFLYSALVDITTKNFVSRLRTGVVVFCTFSQRN